MQTSSCATPWRDALKNNINAPHNYKTISSVRARSSSWTIWRKLSKLRTFIDKISTAPRGYSGMFDAVKINEEELESIYQFDAAFFDLAEQVGRGLDNVEASLGDDAALPAAIRNITSLARLAVETYNRRSEAVTGTK